MPKETFFRLKENKQNLITEGLIDEFKDKNLYQATVKDIVQKLQIPRGSFYQYFESLEDAYFYVLDKKINYIHLAFLKLYLKNKDNLKDVLLTYRDFLSEEIYKDENYKLLHNRYLSWNSQLERNWRKYQGSKKDSLDIKLMYENKRLNIIGWLIHMLMQKLFEDSWDKDRFICEYEELVKFIMGGINYV